jgi:hypothetical protein
VAFPTPRFLVTRGTALAFTAALHAFLSAVVLLLGFSAFF